MKKYEQWLAETERNLTLLMKKTLLVTNENLLQAGLVCLYVLLFTYLRYSIICKIHTDTNYTYSLKFLSLLHLKDAPPTESSQKKGVRYIVNFAPEIKEIISETTNLVSLGYSVSSLAQNVALQEHTLIR